MRTILRFPGACAVVMASLLAVGSVSLSADRPAAFPEAAMRGHVAGLGDMDLARQEEAFSALLAAGRTHHKEVMALLTPETPDPVVNGHCRDLWDLLRQEAGEIPRAVCPPRNVSYLKRKYQVGQVEIVAMDLSTEAKTAKARETFLSVGGVLDVVLEPAAGRAFVKYRDSQVFDVVHDYLNVLNDLGIGGEVKKDMDALGGKIGQEEREAFERFKEEQRTKTGKGGK